MKAVPEGARPAARILVISDDQRLHAAARELVEETGFSAPIGPCVWMRRHQYEWYGRHHDQ